MATTEQLSCLDYIYNQYIYIYIYIFLIRHAQESIQSRLLTLSIWVLWDQIRSEPAHNVKQATDNFEWNLETGILG